jgi:hypothetical protein
MLRQHQCNDLVPQVLAPCSTCTNTMNYDDLRISDLAENAEVDRFGLDLEFAQHDGVQRWSSPRSYIALRGATREREARERKRGEADRRRRDYMILTINLVVKPSSPETLLCSI